MKHLLYFFFFILMCNGSAISQNEQAMFKVDAPVIYPKIRIWTSPALDEEPAFNSPSFQWPSTKKGSYGIRMSTLKDFSDHRIENTESLLLFLIHILNFQSVSGTGNSKPAIGEK
ncbi:MAG: hypothetical protein IPO25_15590 [Saprospiraceae bacterium]|nr:hypothetical protein [Saprospiraceae bacterium]